MVSTSQDMAIWFKTLMSGALLPAWQMQELTTFIDGELLNYPKKIQYGLGIIHNDTTFDQQAIWHSGGTLGYSSIMVWLPLSKTVITVNTNHTSKNKDIYKISQKIAKYFRNHA